MRPILANPVDESRHRARAVDGDGWPFFARWRMASDECDGRSRSLISMAYGSAAMTALLLEPHHDDATLFAAYTCLREKPLVVTVLSDSRTQAGVTGAEREAESVAAMEILGCERVSLGFTDGDPTGMR